MTEVEALMGIGRALDGLAIIMFFHMVVIFLK